MNGTVYATIAPQIVSAYNEPNTLFLNDVPPNLEMVQNKTLTSDVPGLDYPGQDELPTGFFQPNKEAVPAAVKKANNKSLIKLGVVALVGFVVVRELFK